MAYVVTICKVSDNEIEIVFFHFKNNVLVTGHRSVCMFTTFGMSAYYVRRACSHQLENGNRESSFGLLIQYFNIITSTLYGGENTCISRLII